MSSRTAVGWISALIFSIYLLLPVYASFSPTNSFDYKIGNEVFYTESIPTGSMKPTIYGNKLALIKAEENDLKIFDIVVYFNGKDYVVHRIVDIKELNGEKFYLLKGDNNLVTDGFWTFGDIKYKVIYVLH